MNNKETLAQRFNEILKAYGVLFSDDTMRSKLIIDLAAECRAPAPQTPWKSRFTDSDVTGDIHNYVDTGDGKRLWAQDADEIVKRHNEGTSEQAPQELELEQEADGRWLAEFMRFPGVAAYGHTREESIRNAAKVLIESEQASPTPDTQADGPYTGSPYPGTPKGTK